MASPERWKRGDPVPPRAEILAAVAGGLGQDGPADVHDWRPVAAYVSEPSDPVEQFSRVVDVLEACPSRRAIASLAAYIAEPLIQEWWEALLPAIREASTDERFRWLMNGVLLSDLPPDVDDYISSISVSPD